MPSSLSSNSSQVTSTPNFSSQRLPITPEASHYTHYTIIQLKETWRTRGQKPTLLLSRLILDLTRTLVNCWSSLIHASHCMTTSWSAAATQTRVRVSPATQTKIPVTLPISGLGDHLRISWLVYLQAKLWAKYIYSHILCYFAHFYSAKSSTIIVYFLIYYYYGE